MNRRLFISGLVSYIGCSTAMTSSLITGRVLGGIACVNGSVKYRFANAASTVEMDIVGNTDTQVIFLNIASNSGLYACVAFPASSSTTQYSGLTASEIKIDGVSRISETRGNVSTIISDGQPHTIRIKTSAGMPTAEDVLLVRYTASSAYDMRTGYIRNVRIDDGNTGKWTAVFPLTCKTDFRNRTGNGAIKIVSD